MNIIMLLVKLFLSVVVTVEYRHCQQILSCFSGTKNRGIGELHQPCRMADHYRDKCSATQNLELLHGSESPNISPEMSMFRLVTTVNNWARQGITDLQVT